MTGASGSARALVTGAEGLLGAECGGPGSAPSPLGVTASVADFGVHAATASASARTPA
ncbi:MAG TPA: hypothetical protein VMI54_16470 [Polyangiaceae bacterium]|nr:hypothetical protein [Polyangiaceae bacterium]